MPSISHKYTTRLVSGSIKRTKYCNYKNSNNGNNKINTIDHDYEDSDKEYEDSDEDYQDSDEDYEDSDQEEDEDEDEDDDEDNNSDSSLTSSISNVNNKRKFNKMEYYKLLNTLYPSKYSANKVFYETANKNIGKHKIVKDDTNFKNFILRNAMLLKSNSNRLNLSKIINKNNKTNNKLLDNRPKNNNGKNNNGKNMNIIINIKNGDKEHEEEYENEDEEDDEYENGDEEDDEYENGDEEHDEDNDDKYKNEDKTGKKKEDTFDENIVPTLTPIANKNYKIFDKILCNDDKESEYFKKSLSKKEQETLIDKLRTLQNLTKIDKPYLLHLVDLDIPDEYKACALRKINTMRSMGDGFGNSEFYKIKSWVDAFLKIPFNKYNNLPISFADGIERCHDFMEYTKKTLDSVVYGLEDAKIQIMQMVGLWLVNPNAIGCAIAIKGPPGTGKTTLIKEGISKILNRPFALVALGGCGDSGFLDGFDYTYEGSKHGKIIDILIQCGCMNPVILFDELDKLSDSFKGQEVTGVLTHLTDSTQNTKFGDKYFSEISIDMSKALFIFSYNDENAVNNILKDRMYKIETKGYKTKEKLIIAKDYLLPKIRDEIKFDCSTIVFNDELLEYIINDFTEKEDGVRNLKRCLEIIYKKLNLYRLMKPDINLFENSEGLKLKNKICFPCILTREIIDDLINKGTTDNIPYGMYN